jgi:hypothetical protein
MEQLFYFVDRVNKNGKYAPFLFYDGYKFLRHHGAVSIYNSILSIHLFIYSLTKTLYPASIQSGSEKNEYCFCLNSFRYQQ